MVVDSEIQDRTDGVFHALADPTRRDILFRTMQREHSVSELARFYPMSFAAIQKHVAILERCTLISKRRHGREQLVHGEAQALGDVLDVVRQLEQMWRARIERFGTLLANDPDTDDKGAPR